MRRERLLRWLIAVVVGLAACVALLGPILFFGAVALRTTLTDLNRRIVSELSSEVALGARLVGGSVAVGGDQLRALAQRRAVRVALEQRDRATLTTILDEARSGYAGAVSAVAFTPSGVLLARSPDDAQLGQHFEDRDYFQGALSSDGPYVGDAVVSRITGLPVVVIAVAVRDASGVAGVLGFSVEPHTFVGSLAASLRREGREILLVDRTKASLASTGGRVPLQPIVVDSRKGSGRVQIDGANKIGAAEAVPDTTWTLYVIDDPAVVFAEQQSALGQLSTPLLWATTVSGVFAAMLSIVFLMLRRERAELAAANTRLVAANAAAEAATRAKSDFLASMSHELRTPLNAVLGFSEVLREQLGETLSDRQKRYLDNIHAAGAHLLELINDVLDLSRVESGRLVLRPEPLPLHTLLDPVVASAAQLATDGGVTFDPPVVPDAVVRVDPARVRQVLLNLLSNAVKFTPAGGSVALRAAVEGDGLRLEVQDTGIGIPEEQQPKVFGMFERLHEGRSAASGTGLGLAISRRLVELHGGTIGFRSAQGEGSLFWVVLPGVLAEVPTGARVLVVEDEPGDAELIAHLAQQEGLIVEVAPTAASALAAIGRSAPSAVILDLRLPDRRGEEVLRVLKGDTATAGIPVLVVTVEDDDGGVRVLGASDQLTKPIDRERVRRWLAQLRLGGGSPAGAAR